MILCMHATSIVILGAATLPIHVKKNFVKVLRYYWTIFKSVSTVTFFCQFVIQKGEQATPT